MEPFGMLLKILPGKGRQISWRGPFMPLEGSVSSGWAVARNMIGQQGMRRGCGFAMA